MCGPSPLHSKAAPELNQLIHETIREVTEDLEKLGFNTAIAKMMELLNEFYKLREIPKQAVNTFVLLLSPFAPHIAEELWEKLGHAGTIAYEPWPTFDAKIAQKSTVNVAIQVNGKIRDKVDFPADISKEKLEKEALQLDNVQKFLDGKKPKKVIVVPGRLVNILT